MLLTEAKRAGTAEEQIRVLVSKIAETVTDAIRQAFRINPAMFKQRCGEIRGIPPDDIDALTDLRAGYPDAVEMIEQWH